MLRIGGGLRQQHWVLYKAIRLNGLRVISAFPKGVTTCTQTILRGGLLSCSWVNQFAGDEFKEVTESVIVFNKELEDALLLARLQLVFRQVRVPQLVSPLLKDCLSRVPEGLH